jgi:Flp pilus assembly pilin Flp
MLVPLARLQIVLAHTAHRMRRARDCKRGQGTVEYVALITVVALVMVGVIAALKSAQFTEGQELGAMILKKITEAVSKVKY